MKIPTTDTKCPACLGTGFAIDRASFGLALRQSREAAGLTVQEMAWRLHTSTARLSYMERGLRPWSPELLESFIQICQSPA